MTSNSIVSFWSLVSIVVQHCLVYSLISSYFYSPAADFSSAVSSNTSSFLPLLMSEEEAKTDPVPETKKQKMSIPQSPDEEWPEGECVCRCE